MSITANLGAARGSGARTIGGVARPIDPTANQADPASPAYRSLRSRAGLTLDEGFDQLAAAIGDPTRRRIFAALYHDPRPRTAADVAAEQGISRAVARSHLEVLRATGLLQYVRRRGLRGKPAHLYSIDTDSAHWVPHPPRQMGLLAMLILEAASLGPDRIAGLVEQVGEDYGAAIVSLRSGTPPSTVEDALAPLRRTGEQFTVERLDERASVVAIEGSLFRDASRDRPELICHLHLGILRALLDELPVEVEILQDAGLGGGLSPAKPGTAGARSGDGPVGSPNDEVCRLLVRRVIRGRGRARASGIAG